VKVRQFVLRVLLLGLAGVAWAAGGWRRPFEVLGPAQGLPDGGVLCITQDSDGFIWLGSEVGLFRYEGGQSSHWSRNEGMPSDHVDRLAAIPNGGVWASTPQGLVRLRNGRIDLARFPDRSPFTGTLAMAHDSSGRLWIAATRGLFVETEDLTFRPHPQGPPGQVFTVSVGRSGAMLVGGEHGLTAFRPGGAIESWNSIQGLPRTQIDLAREDDHGRFWACSGRTLVMKEPGATRFTDQSRLLKAPITPYGDFFLDRDGSLWLPTLKGALCLQGPKSAALDDTAGLPMRWVRKVFRDREGGLWLLGTAVARLQGNDQLWNHPLAEGPSGVIVWAFLRDARGQLLVGTDDGVFRVGAATHARIPGTEGRRIKGLAIDGTGRLWMVGTTGPALWLGPGELKAREAPLGELGDALNTVMADGAGGIWAGHSRLGILRWDAGKQRLVQEVGPEAAPSGALGAFQMRQDASGRLWVATTRGLYLRERSGAWHLFDEKDGILPFGLHGMAFLPDGSAWVHYTEPQGLQRIRVDGTQITVLERRRAGQGLRSDRIYALEVDPDGHVWATSSQGFECLDSPIHLGRREGMISEDCDLLALMAEKGRIWVGTSAGIVRYDIGEGPTPLAPPRPQILFVQKGEQRLEAPSASLEPVGPRESSLAFRVAVPSYRHEGQMKVQVRLVGLEEDWRDLEAPLTRYPGLPGGQYRFEVRAAQPDGAFGPLASLTFEVLPRWWRTWWALTLWGVAAVGGIVLIVRLRVASLAQSKQELEALVAARTEELRSRNADLIQALGRVKQLSGLLPICASCKKIRDDRGYWNQLEQYISDHSDVGFSHGICPDCVGTMFPDFSGHHKTKAKGNP